MGRMALNFWSRAAHRILMTLAGWIHREQEAVVAYQKEEIRALREMLGGKRLRFTDLTPFAIPIPMLVQRPC